MIPSARLRSGIFKKYLFLLVLIVLLIGLALFSIHSRRESIDRNAERIDAVISSERIRQVMKELAEQPHRAGSQENHQVADAIIKRLQEMGLHVSTIESDANLPSPEFAELWMTYPSPIRIDFGERVLPQDRFSDVSAAETPFFAYAPDADLEGEVIYANFGERKDYAWLKNQGIAVAGKVALVRAQGICRSMKLAIAEEEGVAGLLVYPELKDQGFLKPAYPQGPHLNRWVTQRGSMLRFFEFPGDPERYGSSAIPRVAAIPISGKAAMQLMQDIEGPPVPSDWKGWMDVSYRSGSGPAKVRMVYRSSSTRRKLRSIFADLSSEETSEPAVLAMGHYDAWIYGASDPGSGVAVLLEAAQALKTLQVQGWKPRRPVRFVFWDAEEYGMLASTQWVLENLPEARGKICAIVYIDGIRSGYFNANIDPGLRRILDRVLAQIRDPVTEKVIFESRGEYELPGYSSDTIPFTNFAGVPVAQLNYGMTYPMYHSVYDNLHWMESFGDPGYRYTRNMAKIVGLYLTELSGSEMLPYSFVEMDQFLIATLNRFRFEYGNSVSLTQLIDQLEKQKELATKVESSKLSGSKERLARVNMILLNAILRFTASPDVSESLSFEDRNVLLGPSVENSCAGEELHALQEAFRKEDSGVAEKEIQRLRKILSAVTDDLNQALDELQEN